MILPKQKYVCFNALNLDYFFNLIKTFVKVSLGCYPTGQSWTAFNDGLSNALFSQMPAVSLTYPLVNGFFMFQLASGMTIESCSSICLANSFIFSGIGGFVLFFFK